MISRSINSISASRDARILGEEELRRAVPSIFAEAPHDSRSTRYAYIPTKNVLDGLSREGFYPVAARQARTRDRSRQDFTKHLIRLRREGDTFSDVGDVIPELVLVNSHDGSSSYHLMAGLFRLVCNNGMVVDDAQIASIRVPHKGDVVGDVIDAAFTVVEQSASSLESAEQWSQLQLSPPERQALAESAHVLRFADAEGNVNTPIEPDQLLQPRRYGDRAQDLWTTFNVVQENVIRGGLRGFDQDDTGRRRRRTSRAVKGIDQDVKLNKALWTLASKMADLKDAA